MTAKVTVAGVGMVPFTLPGCGPSLDAMAAAAVRQALEDARLDFDLLDQAFVSASSCDSGSGERILSQVGVSEIPVTSVSSSGASAASALYLARQAILSGQSECVLALGIDGVPEAARKTGSASGGRQTPAPAGTANAMSRERGVGIQVAYLMQNLRVNKDSLAGLVVKSRKRAGPNPNAIHRRAVTVADVLAEPVLPGGLPRSWVSVPACGAAAVIVCSDAFYRRFGLRGGVSILAHEMGADWASDCDPANPLGVLGGRSIARTASAAYDHAGVGPENVDVAEVDDASVANELIACAQLGFCAEKDINGFIARATAADAGGIVVNPSGGMLALGDAPHATGLAQVVELVRQLRGGEGPRQVARARTALQQIGGFGGAVSVAILQSRV